MYSIPCILFAGGKSSRMGENKALLPFADKPTLTQYQFEKLQKSFKDVYISTKEPNLFNEIDAMFIVESEYMDIFAPTVGFVSAFKQLKNQEAIFVVSVDTPFINETIFSQLIKCNFNDYDAVIVRTPKGIHPLCGIYSRSIEPALKNMLVTNDHKLGKLLSKSNVKYVDVAEELLFNMNTPKDYQDALSRVKS
jgi:molybdenum cofactor guanylyltransferase